MALHLPEFTSNGLRTTKLKWTSLSLRIKIEDLTKSHLSASMSKAGIKTSTLKKITNREYKRMKAVKDENLIFVAI